MIGYQLNKDGIGPVDAARVIAAEPDLYGDFFYFNFAEGSIVHRHCFYS